MAQAIPTPTDPRFQDLTGKSFQHLTVIRLDGCKYSGNQRFWIWLCRCDCGREVRWGRSQLKNQKSCGCAQAAAKTKHGMARTAVYQVWQSLKGRCLVKTNRRYKDYGGRGVTVCDGWRDSFVNFQADMGPRPSVKHEVDRINNDGPYSCGHCERCRREGWAANCRWATRKEQCRNTRWNKRLTYKGETRPMAEWAELLGVKAHLICTRLLRGWTVEEAFEIPIRSGFRIERHRERLRAAMEV